MATDGRGRFVETTLPRDWEDHLDEEFAVFEEALEFGLGGFGGVGGVADVAHFGVARFVAEVATDGAGGGFLGVGGSEEVAHFGDDVIASESEGDDGGFLHEFDDFWEEGFVGDVGVVFGEECVGEFHHFEAFDLEACAFVAVEDGADEALGYGVGLEENEGRFLCHLGVA